MKIIILSRGYPTEAYPMNGIFEFDQAKAINEIQGEVIFAALDLRSIRHWRKWGLHEFYKDGVKIYALNIPVGNVPKRLFYAIANLAVNYLYKIIEKKEGSISIIHAHFLRMGFIATKIKKRFDTKLIMTEHLSQLMKKSLSEEVKYLGEHTYSYMDKVLAVSPALQEALNSNFNVQSKYIPNVVDTDLFGISKINKNDEFTFITIGNLIIRKRIDLVVEAFAEFNKIHPETKLLIIGDGEQRNIITNLINRLKLMNCVVLLGRLDRKNISAYLNKSHVFVLPSREETFGVVYTEAMAAGLPVIATTCGGPEHLVNSTNGVLIKIDDKTQLLNAMFNIYKDYEKYDNASISSNAIDEFSPKNVAMKIINEYNTII